MFTIKKHLARAGVMLAVAAMAGCSSTPTYPPAPTQSGSYNWNYLIGPGDSVQVFVWRNPEVSGTFPVRPDGKMTMNLVEDIRLPARPPPSWRVISRRRSANTSRNPSSPSSSQAASVRSTSRSGLWAKRPSRRR